MKFRLRYGNFIPLRKLQEPAPDHRCPPHNALMLILDSQDIKESCEVMGIRSMGKITGVLARAKDGDFSDFYVTESARPFSLDADYRRVTRTVIADRKSA